MGLPTVSVLTADNQRRYFDGLTRVGAAVGATFENAADAVARLAGDVARRRALSLAATDAVDGRGAQRVAEAVVALC